jgi:hypothetical protein
MVYAILLGAHIANALVTGAVIGYICYAVVKGWAAQYNLLALLLAGIAMIEVATGISLTFVSPNVTALSLALHMTAYLSVCFGVEILLYVAKRYRPA